MILPLLRLRPRVKCSRISHSGKIRIQYRYAYSGKMIKSMTKTKYQYYRTAISGIPFRQKQYTLEKCYGDNV